MIQMFTKVLHILNGNLVSSLTTVITIDHSQTHGMQKAIKINYPTTRIYKHYLNMDTVIKLFSQFMGSVPCCVKQY